MAPEPKAPFLKDHRLLSKSLIGALVGLSVVGRWLGWRSAPASENSSNGTLQIGFGFRSSSNGLFKTSEGLSKRSEALFKRSEGQHKLLLRMEVLVAH